MREKLIKVLDFLRGGYIQQAYEEVQQMVEHQQNHHQHGDPLCAPQTAQPAFVHPVERIKPLTDTDFAYAYADGWNACVEHHKTIAKTAQLAPKKGQE